ncbi:AAA family ATPase [Xylophilus sp. Kf1]|nr:AAA family ATPase [Xylophilus sp. Kf1]
MLSRHRTHTVSIEPHASTGISGLDNILVGGLPPHHLYLVEGTPGSGKTTLGLQFLLQGREAGERSLYITLSETSSELRLVAASHGWNLDGVDVFDLVGEDGLSEEAEQSILHPSEFELGETTRDVIEMVQRLQPTRVVFDSLSEMRLLAQSPLRYRRQILALKRFFANRGCTVLMLDDKSGAMGDVQLHSIAHGVINLEQNPNDYGPDKRRLRVVKLRGVKFREGEHDFNLARGGLQVFPRLVANEHSHRFDGSFVTTGTSGLDELLGGGLVPGSNMLLTGPAGTGKTTTAISCAVHAMRRGEKVAYYLFDEGLGTLRVRCKALGLDIDPFVASGHLMIRALDPAELSPGQFAYTVRAAVETDEARMVVIDSINAYLQAMPGGKFLLLQMHELLAYLNLRGVISLLILSQHGAAGDIRSDIDLSYLSDGMLQFRFFEARGMLRKGIYAIKSRTAQHELTTREFRLGADGLEIGQPLHDFEGLLGGIARYSGSMALLGDGAPGAPGATGVMPPTSAGS